MMNMLQIGNRLQHCFPDNNKHKVLVIGVQMNNRLIIKNYQELKYIKYVTRLRL